MNVKVKLFHKKSILPFYADENSATVDLIAVRTIKKGLFKVWYDCEIACEIPKNHVGLIFPKNSINKKPLIFASSIGIIDSNYKETIRVCFNRTFAGIFSRKKYKLGDKIAQLLILKLPVPKIKFVKSELLSKVIRDKGGFGSIKK